MQLVEAASSGIFEKKNEQNLFSWYLLLKSGYDVKVGYDEDKVCLLIPSVQKIYGVLYMEMHQATYYIFGVRKDDVRNLKTYKGDYPGNKLKFSFDLPCYTSFSGEQTFRTLYFKNKKVTLSFNKEAFDFLNSYPLCELGAYFHSGISQDNFVALDSL